MDAQVLALRGEQVSVARQEVIDALKGWLARYHAEGSDCPLPADFVAQLPGHEEGDDLWYEVGYTMDAALEELKVTRPGWEDCQGYHEEHEVIIELALKNMEAMK